MRCLLDLVRNIRADSCTSSVAISFAISRRRKGVPLSKRWEADFARIQIVKRDNTIQLLAFFRDFSHGSCMNFELRVMDTFEALEKGGQYCLRMVNAKFALPTTEGDSTKDFLCLDLPEYPSEHDNILVGFHDESGECTNPLSRIMLTSCIKNEIDLLLNFQQK